jgi:hypothetical protein
VLAVQVGVSGDVRLGDGARRSRGVLAVGGLALGGWRLVVEARLRSWAAGMRQEQAERKKFASGGCACAVEE